VYRRKTSHLCVELSAALSYGQHAGGKVPQSLHASIEGVRRTGPRQPAHAGAACPARTGSLRPGDPPGRGY